MKEINSNNNKLELLNKSLERLYHNYFIGFLYCPLYFGFWFENNPMLDISDFFTDDFLNIDY